MGILSLNSNIAALTAQRALASSQDRLGTILQRLSSGQRINGAGDDAAGIAIADNLRTQSRLFGAANRNINDALSMMNIIGSTLDEQSDILHRLAELAEQSANGTLSSTQRGSLNSQFQTLVREFGRIGDSTQFNGVNLMLGGRGANSSSVRIQAGIDGSSNSSLELGLTDTGTISGTINLDNLAFATAIDFQLWITGAWGRTNFSTDELAGLFGNAMFQTTGTDSNGRTREVLIGAASSTFGDGKGVNLISFVRSTDDPDIWQNTINISDLLAVTGSSFSVLFDSSGRSTSVLNPATHQDGVTFSLTLEGLRGSGSVFGTSAGTSSLEFANLLSHVGSRKALDIVNRRLDELSSSKGQVGATGSRLQSALSLVDVSKENSLAAESRIRDVDVAFESARLVSERIKQQTAAQVLAMANQQPALILSLLNA